MIYDNPKPDKEAFEQVCKELEYSSLNLRHVGRVFGQAFWEVLVITLIDAREAKALLDEMKKNG